MSNLLKPVAPAPFDFGAIFSNIGKNWYYYLTLFITVVLLILFACLKKKKRNAFNPTQKIVYISIMTVICFVANSLTTIQVSKSFQISFVALAGFIAGYMFGPVGGFVSAFIGDFIGGIVTPLGVYNPIIGIGTGMWGFVPGLIFERFGGNDYVKAVVSFVISFVLSSFLINTIGLSLMFGISFEKLMVSLPFKLLTTAINGVLGVVLIPVFPRILPKDKFPFLKREETVSQN